MDIIPHYIIAPTRDWRIGGLSVFEIKDHRVFRNLAAARKVSGQLATNQLVILDAVHVLSKMGQDQLPDADALRHPRNFVGRRRQAGDAWLRR